MSGIAGTLVYVVIVIASYIYAVKKNREGAKKAAKKGLLQVLKQIPMLVAIFLLVGLFDIFVPQDTVMKIVGQGQGLLSYLASALFGTVVMGPVSSAYPIGAILLKKGAALAAVAIFLNSWVMVGFVTIPYEISVFGKKFTFVRNALALVGAIFIGLLTAYILGVWNV